MSEDIHYMTPAGYKALADEQDHLIHTERPKICEIVSWAAGNGDRSENGDYIYNKKRLREIDRRLRYLKKKLDNCKIVDPKDQQNLTRVYFGATVTYVREDDSKITVHLVGVDEADFSQNKINWLSPVGKALLKHEVGDSVKVRVDGQIEEIEILEIKYMID
ncbi:MAG TPA: transcription elongation factor GreB [Alphaproteobacteria bacterium]|nr:transcription elongation factor GreB [Alphaproteobacteria bacterium]USO05225.1 MAG: transcription elongation factor GreB [Rhodospirillales bacterium]HOO81006.1 transcription elongation factor GreB [Alphaproteobacteria bacterium]